MEPQTTVQALADLREVKKGLLATINGFGTDEEIAAAQLAIPEIDLEIASIEKAISEGAEFVADGAEPQNQFSDVDGSRFICSDGGTYEPDITSLNCAEGEAIVSSTPQGKPESDCCDDATAGKRSRSKKGGKPKESEIPGMLRKTLPDGDSTLVVGPSNPEGGYPPLPTYSHLLIFADVLIDMDSGKVAKLWMDSKAISEDGAERCRWIRRKIIKAYLAKSLFGEDPE